MGGFKCSGAFFHCCHILLLFEVFFNIFLKWPLRLVGMGTYQNEQLSKYLYILFCYNMETHALLSLFQQISQKYLDSKTIASSNPHYIAENDLFTYSRFSSSSARWKSQAKINLPAWRSRQILLVFVGERRGPGFVKRCEQSIKNRWSRTHRNILLQEWLRQ